MKLLRIWHLRQFHTSNQSTAIRSSMENSLNMAVRTENSHGARSLYSVVPLIISIHLQEMDKISLVLDQGWANRF